MLVALCWLRYRTARGYVSSTVLVAVLNCEWICYQHCVGCGIELRVDMLAAAVLGAILICEWIC